MRKQLDANISDELKSLKSEVARLENQIQDQAEQTKSLILQLHTDMWNMVQAINSSQAETVGLSVVSRLTHEMEKVRGLLGDMRQEMMKEIRQTR